ncbi:MAG: hypothetical protein AB1736_11660 [Chloroflexota bacterium]
MATTEQRTGFRLPWASEPRPGVSAEAQTQPTPDSAPVAEGETTADPTTAEATEMQEVTIPDPRAMSWPDADAANDATAPGTATHDAATGTPADQAAANPTRPRRENLLVTGLVRAMRDAAMAAREETADRFAAEAKARVETIHARGAEEAAELRKQADAEIVEIRDWSKAEMARIREETEKRIADRKQHLEAEVERHAALVQHRIEQVDAAVGEFERRMEAFFVQLMAEEDPARLAGLAEDLPEAPSLDLDDLDRSTPDFPMAILDARGAAAAEAAALADLDASGDDDGTATLPDDEVSAIPDDDVARRLDAFTVHAPATGDAASSQLAVLGLVSVASIAGFKRALARTHGVRSVTVASGPSGDFLFTVSHDPETDLRSAVPALDGFAAVITGDADGVLTITATDPETAR